MFLAPPPVVVAPPVVPSSVEGVTIIAPRDPKVVGTFPAEGASTPYGVVVIRVAFDQAMVAEAWSYGRSPQGAFPDCLARPRLLADGRSFALLCSLPAQTAYALEINAAPSFLSAAGREAKPHVLHFSTTDANTRSVHDALTLADLDDTDDPIMTWNGASGVSQSKPPAVSEPADDVSRTGAPHASAGAPR